MKVDKRFFIVLGIVMACLLGFFIYNRNSSYREFNKNYDFEQDIKNGDIRLLTFGLEDFELEGKFDSWANKYGFKYDNLSCMSTAEDVAFADNYNAKVINYLITRNGVGWYERFEKESQIIELVNDQPHMENMVRDIDAVVIKERLIDSLSKGKRHLSLSTIVTDTPNHLYLIKVMEANGLSLYTHFTYQVNGKTLAYKRIN